MIIVLEGGNIRPKKFTALQNWQKFCYNLIIKRVYNLVKFCYRMRMLYCHIMHSCVSECAQTKSPTKICFSVHLKRCELESYLFFVFEAAEVN